jgi:pyrroloquinoline quinone biosynthesis protein E
MSPRPKVYAIAIEVTAHCQQKCTYCYNAWREDNGASLDGASGKTLLARVEKVLESLDVDHVTITGGEPFARRDVFDLLDVVRARGVRIQIVSNGGLVDDALAERLAGYDVSYVQVTLDGPNAKIHDEHVGGQGHFKKTLAGIRALRKAGVPVVGCIVVTRKNAARIAETLGLFRDLDVKHIALSRFSPAGYAASHAAELLPSRDDLLTAFRQAIPFAKRGMDVTCTMPVPPCTVETEELAPLKFGTCAIGTSMQEFALGPDGRLRNCTLHGKGLGGDADVLEMDLAAIVTGGEVASYKKVLPEFCEGCLHAGTCGGGCGAASEWVLGSRRFPDPLVWQHVDDAFGARLASESAAICAGKRRLEVIG